MIIGLFNHLNAVQQIIDARIALQEVQIELHLSSL
jgi:hypothetical protein